MIEVRKRESIYHKEGGSFSANWHFSFDEYDDPANLGFGTLRVFNDETLRPGAAWPMHAHRDVEAIIYVVAGTFEHRDSLGNDGVLPPGSVQRATLGRGMWHAEANHSPTEPLRFLQMWIVPRVQGLEPSVEQRTFAPHERANRLLPVVTPSGVGTVKVHQNASVFVAALDQEAMVGHDFLPGMGAYVFLIRGAVTLDGVPLAEGDAARVWGEDRLAIRASAPAELLLVEVEVEVEQPEGPAAGDEERQEAEETE
ncbi:MAG: pirin family protein [Chloroflexi bacterium]|nr:pirin family protein [Chloroflexota bacterium]